jgi:uncharacterized lipoprotein YddW (UPF0748 family)
MWIDEAHAHGLQLHAWFNPYRAKSPSAKSALAPKHIGVRTPSAVKAYGDLLWMDPSSTQAQQQTLAVIRDVVRRYDIDGVHIDDYFYPYPIKGSDGTEVEFPDTANWTTYQQAGGELSRADWRREHVNQLVKAIHTTIHAEKAWMKFGISPFGIGRPDRLPTGIAGFSQYDKLYADVEYWLEQAWLDYLAPQLYWPIKQSAQAFPVLHDYWLAQNKQNRHVWPGLYTSRIDQSDKSWNADEIASQVELTRTKVNAGHIHFSFKALMEDRKGISATLGKAQYQTMALVPSMPWLETNAAISAEQLKPILDLNDSKNTLKVSLPNLVDQQLLAIWKRYDQEWFFSVQAISQLSISLKPDALRGKLQEVTVSSVNRNGIESARSSFVLPELR